MQKSLFVFVVLVFMMTGACWAGLLTDGSFESPPDTNGWTGSAWTSAGSASREDWAAHSGGRGVAFATWSGDAGVTNQASVLQFVAVDVVAGQDYTFSSWIRKQRVVRDQAIKLQVRWWDASWISLTTMTENVSVPGDDAWHQVCMTRTAVPSAAHATVTIVVEWVVPADAGPSALMMDDADFYEGSYAGAPFLNGGLSHTNTASGGWAGSGWNRGTLQPSTNDPRVSLAGWANRSGPSLGAVLEGWNEDDGGIEFFQNFAPGTGVYTFAVWINRLANMDLSNAELRIGWYDSSFTNKVQADSVLPLGVSSVDGWHEYFVTGQCSDPNLREVRVSVVAKWGKFDGQANTLLMDDARVVSGAYVPTYAAAFTNGGFENPAGTEDWNNTGWTCTGNARRTNWAARTGARGLVVESWAANQTAVFQDIASAAGTCTFSAWIQVPTNATPLSNRLVVEWGGDGGSILKTDVLSLNGVPQDGNWYRAFVTTTCTNAGVRFVRPILFALYGGEKVANAGANTIGFDDAEFYTGPLVVPSSFENGGFENPATTNLWAGSSWTPVGSVSRETWAGRTSAWGGVVQAWVPGGAGAVYQDVAATGGTYTLSLWLLKQKGANPTNTQLRLEWYNGSQWEALHTDVAQLDAAVPGDGRWHHAWVTSTYSGNDALFLRAKLACQFAPGAATDTAIMFDEASLYRGTHIMPSFPSVLRDGGFNAPHTNWQELGWSRIDPVYLQDWAAIEGNLGGVLPTWEGAKQGAVYQDISVGPGTYTFSLWIRQQVGSHLTNASVSIEWYSSAQIAPAQVDSQSLGNVPADGRWHLVHVTGSYSGGDLSFVRPVFHGQYAAGEASENAIVLDQAEFYSGPFAAAHALANGDFADRLRWWTTTPGQNQLQTHSDWGGHSGSHILAVEGWWGDGSSFSSVVAQTLVNVSPGTYRFSGWFKRDIDFALNQANLRVQGYNASHVMLFDVITNLTIMPNGQWTQFSVDVPCTAGGLYEVVPSIGLAWTKVNGSLQLDDFAFEFVGGGSDTDSDGIADAWELQHFGSLTGTGVGSNYDGDAWTDLQEYAADTDPKNAGSAFSFGVPANSSGLRVFIGPPTTNTRVYQMFWTTNLTGGTWTPYTTAVAGHSDGGAIEVLVTNNVPLGYYRARVAVP